MLQKVSLVVLQLTVLVASIFILLPAQPAQAACRDRLLGVFPTWYHYLQTDGDCNVQFPQKDNGEGIDLPKAATSIAFAILDILLRVAGLVAVIFVVVGGFTFITSNGQPDRAKSARNTILNALIGVVIAMSAAIIVNIIGKALISGA